MKQMSKSANDHRLSALAGYGENDVIVSLGKGIVKQVVAGPCEGLGSLQLAVIDAGVVFEDDLAVMLIGIEDSGQLCQHGHVIGMACFRREG